MAKQRPVVEETEGQQEAREQGSSGPAVSKTVAPFPSSAEFLEAAKPLMISLGEGKALVAEAREFGSGSYGWYAGEKVTLMVGGIPVKVQCNMSLVVVGSKPK
jgi:hypothetical protein